MNNWLKNTARIATLSILATMSAAALATDVTVGPGLNFALPDGTGSGGQASFEFSDSGTVGSVSLTAALDHTYVGDLIVDLHAPDGTTITLMDRPGDPGIEFGDDSNLSKNFPITFDDGASTAAEQAGAACNGTDSVIGQSCPDVFKPDQALSTFNGKNIAGTWAVTLYDMATGDPGTVDALILSIEAASSSAPQGRLENPPNGSLASGIGLISGWHCNATGVTIQVDDFPAFDAAYGTGRGDTVSACGDNDNGFGYLFNFNLLGDGQHTARALADGTEFARSTFTVTTLGTDFLRGANGVVQINNFPQSGANVSLQWEQAQQNFVIAGVQGLTSTPTPTPSASPSPTPEPSPSPTPAPEPITGPVSYTGITSPAIITAAGISTSISGLDNYTSACTEGATATSVLDDEDLSYPIDALKTLFQAARGYVNLPAARNVSFSFPGPCGGSVSFSGVHDNGDTNGNISFSSFCVPDSATGVSATTSGGIAAESDGHPTATGPETDLFRADSPNTLNITTSDGKSFTVAFTGLVYTYGAAGRTATESKPDNFSLGQFMIRNDYSGNVTKFENIDVDVAYLSPVPSPSSLSSGTVKVSGGGTMFFPNTGTVQINTGSPLIIDRSADDLEAGSVVFTGANNEKVTMSVMSSNPGVLSVTADDPGYTGSVMDCSDLSIKAGLDFSGLVVDRINSGF